MLRLGPHGDFVGNLYVLAVVGEGLVLGPGFNHHLQGFAEPLAGLGHRNAEPGKFMGLVSPANAADEPAVDEVVQDRYLFRQSQRLPDGQHQDSRGDLQTLGLLADVEGLQQRRGRIPVIGEVVLGDETVVEPHLFRVLDLLNTFSVEGLPIPQFGVRPFVEKTKLHVCSPVLCCRQSAYTGAVAVRWDCRGREGSPPSSFWFHRTEAARTFMGSSPVFRVRRQSRSMGNQFPSRKRRGLSTIIVWMSWSVAPNSLRRGST